MGYTTEFQGQFDLNKPLTQELANYLNNLSGTRRMKRNLDSKFGVDDAHSTAQVMAKDAQDVGVSTPEALAAEGVGWVNYPIPEEVSVYGRMHLTRDQVRKILPVLQHFVDHGELPD